MHVLLAIHFIILLSGALGGVLLWRLRRRRGALIAILITPVLMFGWYHVTAIDKVASWLYPSDTEYARGFSEEAFAAIPLGSDRQGVLKHLGEPLSKRRAHNGREYWYYSRPGTNYDNYWNFIVILDEKGDKVVERFHEFYTD